MSRTGVAMAVVADGQGSGRGPDEDVGDLARLPRTENFPRCPGGCRAAELAPTLVRGPASRTTMPAFVDDRQDMGHPTALGVRSKNPARTHGSLYQYSVCLRGITLGMSVVAAGELEHRDRSVGSRSC